MEKKLKSYLIKKFPYVSSNIMNFIGLIILMKNFKIFPKKIKFKPRTLKFYSEIKPFNKSKKYNLSFIKFS